MPGNPYSGRFSISTILFRLTLGFALLFAARSLFVDLPNSATVRRELFNEPPQGQLPLRRQLEDAIGPLPDQGNVFALFRLPAGEMTAAAAYFTWTYLLYPRTIYVDREPRVINDSRDLAEPAEIPDSHWLTERDVQTILFVETDAGGKMIIRTKRPDRSID